MLCFAVVMQSFIMNSHEVFIHIHQGCFVGTGAIVRLPQCQWSKPDGYGKISQCITTTKHSKAKTVCIFLGIYCIYSELIINTYISEQGGTQNVFDASWKTITITKHSSINITCKGEKYIGFSTAIRRDGVVVNCQNNPSLLAIYYFRRNFSCLGCYTPVNCSSISLEPRKQEWQFCYFQEYALRTGLSNRLDLSRLLVVYATLSFGLGKLNVYKACSIKIYHFN